MSYQTFWGKGEDVTSSATLYLTEIGVKRTRGKDGSVGYLESDLMKAPLRAVHKLDPYKTAILLNFLHEHLSEDAFRRAVDDHFFNQVLDHYLDEKYASDILEHETRGVAHVLSTATLYYVLEVHVGRFLYDLLDRLMHVPRLASKIIKHLVTYGLPDEVFSTSLENAPMIENTGDSNVYFVTYFGGAILYGREPPDEQQAKKLADAFQVVVDRTPLAEVLSNFQPKRQLPTIYSSLLFEHILFAPERGAAHNHLRERMAWSIIKRFGDEPVEVTGKTRVDVRALAKKLLCHKRAYVPFVYQFAKVK